MSARRFSFLCFKSLGALLILVAVGLGLVAARLSQGPLKLDGLGDKIASALDGKFGRGAHFRLGDTSLVQRGFGPSLTIDKLAISGPDGAAVLFAPKAEVSVDPFALLFGKVVPRRLEVFDVTLKLALLKNGHLALAAGDSAKPFFEIGGHDDAAPAPEPTPDAAAPSAGRRAVVMREAGSALRQFMDVLTDPGSTIAAVDRLGISRGKLVIEDQVTDQVTTYKDLDLSFDRAHGKTSFALAAEGPSGRWSVAALAAGRPGSARSFNLKVDQLSIDELQLLTGSRSLGVESDMPLGLDARYRAEARQRSGRGGRRLQAGSRLPAAGRSGSGADLHQDVRRGFPLEPRGPDRLRRQPALRRGRDAFQARRQDRPATRRERPLDIRARPKASLAY